MNLRVLKRSLQEASEAMTARTETRIPKQDSSSSKAGMKVEIPIDVSQSTSNDEFSKNAIDPSNSLDQSFVNDSTEE